MSASTDPRATRKDAVRNRAKLVETAAAVLRDEGLDASVNAIAKQAGVNVATLYRHFPTKDDLVIAVLDAVLEPLTVARDRALATDGDVLSAFVRAAVQEQAGHQGLKDVLGVRPASEDLRERLRGPAMAIVTPVVERAHLDGGLRADFDAVDLLVALRMVSVLPADPPDPLRGRERYADALVRGMRPG